MSDKDKSKKSLSFTEGKKQKEQKKPGAKPRVTLGWILGMAVLLLIAASFVLGPTIGALVGKRTQNSVVFGTYGKEKIRYELNNYFYDRVQEAYANPPRELQGNPELMHYWMWRSAYDATVVDTAINQLAKQAKIEINNDVLNRAIINSGVYHKDGKFDEATYNKATTERKRAVESSIRHSLLHETVMGDISSVLAAEGETEYVGAMASSVRDFSYLYLSPALYPNSAAVAYALEHKSLFETIDISIISLASLEDAEELYTSLKSGLYSFEEAAREQSLDSYASGQGYIGEVPYFAITPNFRYEEEGSALLSGESGSILGPFETNGGWAIYQINAAAEEADLASDATLNLVKNYIASYESELMSSYLSNLVEEVNAYAQAHGLVAAAQEFDLEVATVLPTSYNVSNATSLLYSFSYTDPMGVLASTLTTDVTNQLFTADEHTLLDPIYLDGAYLLVEVGEDSTDDVIGNLATMMYSNNSANQIHQDSEQLFYSSDLHASTFDETYGRVFRGL